jgi:hypothetical protein
MFESFEIFINLLAKKPQAQPTVSSQLQPSSIPANLLSQIQGPQRMNIEEESKKKEPIRKPQTKGKHSVPLNNFCRNDSY